MITQQRNWINDLIEGIALTLILCGAMAVIDYFTIHIG
jgi:hypothetical protein